MNVADAINHLKNRKHWIHSIELVGKNLYKVKYKGFILEEENVTARELIKMAKIYSSENNQNTAIKKNVKKFDNDKNRAATRDVIKTEDFDKIPQNGKVKPEDIWSWD